MATQPKTTGLVSEDLQQFPDDNFRREIIDGELIATPAPSTRHQGVMVKLSARLFAWVEEHGGQVFVAPTDVWLSGSNVVEPDVLFVRPENLGRVERSYVRSTPDVVVEVSSPSTRRLEIVRKRDLYERFRVPEYWYVDLDAERVEVFRLGAEGYGHPLLLGRRDRLQSPQVPGFALDVDDLLGPADAG